MQWQDSEQISRRLETTFNDILETRMRDVPVVNPALSVQAVGFLPYQRRLAGRVDYAVVHECAVVAGAGQHLANTSTRQQFSRTFPYGVFEFTLANEAQLGIYALCSLFSPMFQFADQAAAVAAAQAALQGLLTSPAPRAVSRRDLLRGNLGSGNV